MSYAFIFPGQGSQSVEMLSDLAENYSLVKETFDEASSVLDYDLWEVVQKGPEEKLDQTEITQPAMLTAGVAVFRILSKEKNLVPSCMAGHSLGEYSALVAAGSLTLQEGVKLVEARGRLMQAAVPEGQGAMAAILGLEDHQVMDICEQVDDIVEAANFNSPGQIVIAGSKAGVDKSLPLFENAGAKRVVPLAVSVPSHCSLMQPAAIQLKEHLDAIHIREPSIPVLHNVNVAVSESIEEIKVALIEQLYKPVQWVKIIENMKSTGVDCLYELGPGKVLMGLNRRIDRKLTVLPVYDTVTAQKALESF